MKKFKSASGKYEPSDEKHLGLLTCDKSFEQFTGKTTKKHRVLKALHLLPKKQNKTSVSVQVGAPAGGWNTDLGGPLTYRLSQYEKVNKQLNDIICMKERETEDLQQELLEHKYEKERLQQTIQAKDDKLNKLLLEQSLTKKKLNSLEQTNETTLLENEFLLEDKEHIHKELDKSMKRLHVLHNEIKMTQEERDSFAELYINTKVKSSELLGSYLDQLNSALEERRHWLEQAKFGASAKRKTLIAAVETNIKLQEERNRLVEQVEFLSAKTAAQEMHIDRLQIDMSKMAKCVYAYQEKTGLTSETIAGSHISVCESSLSIPVPVLTSTPVSKLRDDTTDKDGGDNGDMAENAKVAKIDRKRSCSESSRSSIRRKYRSKNSMLTKKSLLRYFEDLRISK